MLTNADPAAWPPPATRRPGTLALQVGLATVGCGVATGWLFGFLVLFSYGAALVRGTYEPLHAAALIVVLLSAAAWCLPTAACLGYLIGSRATSAAGRAVDRSDAAELDPWEPAGPQYHQHRLRPEPSNERDFDGRRLAFHRWLALHGRYAADQAPDRAAARRDPASDWS